MKLASARERVDDLVLDRVHLTMCAQVVCLIGHPAWPQADALVSHALLRRLEDQLKEDHDD